MEVKEDHNALYGAGHTLCVVLQTVKSGAAEIEKVKMLESALIHT